MIVGGRFSGEGAAGRGDVDDERLRDAKLRGNTDRPALFPAATDLCVVGDLSAGIIFFYSSFPEIPDRHQDCSPVLPWLLSRGLDSDPMMGRHVR